MSALLSVHDLSVVIGTTHPNTDPVSRPVAGVSFDMAAGETFALLGESGCGKSLTALALLRLLPGAARIAGGRLEFAESGDLCALSETAMRAVRGGRIGMIFQEPGSSLNPVMRIGAQIAEALMSHAGLHATTAAARVVDLLTAVGIPDPARRATEYPFQMSGGMKQRVMIALALAGEPALLIADEPTTALDVTIQAQVLELLRELQRQRGMALLLITHDLGVVAQMADRVGVMYAGHLVEVAPRAAFFAAPGHPYTRRLFAALPDAASRRRRLATIPGSVPAPTLTHVGCRFVARCDVAVPLCQNTPPPWHDVAPGHAVRCHLAAPLLKVGAGGTAKNAAADATTAAATDAAADTAAARRDTVLLEVRDLTMHFPIRRGVLQRTVGQVRAVDGMSLALPAGRTLALVGESGCGKTTAGKAILGLLRPSGGTLTWQGAPLRGLRPTAMQMVFQDPFGSLNPRLRVADIVAEGLQALRRPGDHAAHVGALLEQVGLTADMASRYPHEFSGGQRQRIAIARALAVQPRLLICDEPTSALDVSVQAQILNLLTDLQARLGLAYLFITHNMAVVDYLAHEVAVMYLGRIVEQGHVDEVLRGARHPYTQALLAAVPKITGDNTYLRVAGDPPSPANPPSGCHFHPRCPRAVAACRSTYPDALALSASHRVCCIPAVVHGDDGSKA